jgi:hypothetical protein
MGFRPRDRVPGFDFTEPVGQIPRVFRIRRGPFALYDKRGDGCRRPSGWVRAHHGRGNASACLCSAALPTDAGYELSGLTAAGVGLAGTKAR